MTDSLKTLEKESRQTLNTMDNKTQFIQDVLDGRWDIVLKNVSKLSLGKDRLFDIYEQVEKGNRMCMAPSYKVYR